MISTPARPADTTIEIPPERDPRLVDGAGMQRQRLGRLSSVQRASLVLERYPELRALPNCDWLQLSVRMAFGVLFGESSRHFAHLQMAALAGVVASAGVNAAYAVEMDVAVRSVLDQLQQQFGISTPQAITLDAWEAWGRNTHLMQTLTMRLRKYAAAVNHHLADYRERLSREDQARIGHLLLPPLPKQFRQRFVPEAEWRATGQRNRKAKTDVVSECATAILALMLARYPTMDRFIRWYRLQIERIDTGELRVPARLVYEDDQLDLPRQPGPEAASVEQLHWQTSRVRLDLTIWRPYEFSQRRYTDWIQETTPGTPERERALNAHRHWKERSQAGVYADPHAYFVEVHPSTGMPWFMGPISHWSARLSQGARHGKTPQADARTGALHAGLGTPEDWLVGYLAQGIASDRRKWTVPNGSWWLLRP